jgi:hypothetical protein
MEQEKFSNSLIPFNGNIENPALQDSLSLLYSTLEIDSSNLFEWSDSAVALAVDINVSLPSLGNYDGIDIQQIEPVLIVFNLKRYPTFAPRVYTDRLSFPKKQLAHLYIANNDRPPAFCLVRGNMDDWYAMKRITDLVIRIGNWMRDAATGELATDSNQFDPMRLEGYSGIVIYDYDQIAEFVNKKQSFLENGNTAIALFKRTDDDSSYQFVKFITKENYLEIDEELKVAFKREAEELRTDHFHIGYIVWSQNDKINNQYLIDVPKDFKNLKTFCEGYGINLDQMESIISEADTNYFKGIPVIVAIRRPKKVIGYNGNIEFSNHIMVVDNSDKIEGKIKDEVSVKLFSHNQPLTQKMAKIISGAVLNDELSLVLGCGALGSKIVMHIARSGQQKLLLSDPDVLSPHNMTRHALLGNQVGINKATAIVKSLEQIFPNQKTEISAVEMSGLIFTKLDISKHLKWVFDFTASENVINELINEPNLTTPKICRANISDFGNLGVMLIEGVNRNPRIDDLQIYLHSLYDKNLKVSEWLERENKNSSNNAVSLNVGVGCNSETTILADDVISSHAAYFSAVIKKQMENKSPKGKIFLNRIVDGENYTIENEVIDIEPFEILTAANDKSWSIRFKAGIIERITTQAKKAGKKETGGVFIGVANYKTKTIHVTDLIDAPPDSKANEVCFFRGHKGLPEKIAVIREKSGNQLGYIGEWHSHPHGPDGLSTTDMATVTRFKSEFDKEITPLPVFLTVVTPRYVLPFIF